MSLAVLVLVLAHFSLKRAAFETGRRGNLVRINMFEENAYEGEWLKVRPSLIFVGSSPQVFVAADDPNYPTRPADYGESTVDNFAEIFERRYPAGAPRTYMTFAAPTAGTAAAFPLLGLWLHRADLRSVPVVLEINSLNPFEVEARPPYGPMRSYPESTRELMATLEAPSPAEAEHWNALTRTRPLSVASLESGW